MTSIYGVAAYILLYHSIIYHAYWLMSSLTFLIWWYCLIKLSPLDDYGIELWYVFVFLPFWFHVFVSFHCGFIDVDHTMSKGLVQTIPLQISWLKKTSLQFTYLYIYHYKRCLNHATFYILDIFVPTLRRPYSRIARSAPFFFLYFFSYSLSRL